MAGGVPVAGASPWECRAAQSRQARPKEAQQPSSGTAKGRMTVLGCLGLLCRGYAFQLV